MSANATPPITDHAALARELLYGDNPPPTNCAIQYGQQEVQRALDRIISALQSVADAAVLAERERIESAVQALIPEGKPDAAKRKLLVSVVDVLAAIDGEKAVQP